MSKAFLPLRCNMIPFQSFSLLILCGKVPPKGSDSRKTWLNKNDTHPNGTHTLQKTQINCERNGNGAAYEWLIPFHNCSALQFLHLSFCCCCRHWLHATHSFSLRCHFKLAIEMCRSNYSFNDRFFHSYKQQNTYNTGKSNELCTIHVTLISIIVSPFIVSSCENSKMVFSVKQLIVFRFVASLDKNWNEFGPIAMLVHASSLP